MQKTQNSRLFGLLLLATVLLGAGLRLFHLGSPSLWWDECITLGIAQLGLADMLHTLANIAPSDVGVELFPPLTHILTHFLLKLGANDVTVRLLPVACGIATIPVVYLLGAELFNRRVGLYAALLTALSVFHIHYSRELRPYSLFLLVSLAALLYLYRGLTRNRARDWLAYAGSTLLMLYTSYMAATNLAAHGLFVVLYATSKVMARSWTPGLALRRLIPFGLAAAAALALFSPWIPAYLNIYILLRNPSAVPRIPLDFILTTLREFSAYAATVHGNPWPAVVALSLIGTASALVRGKALPLALLALWAFLPVAGFLAAKTVLGISSRYVFNAFFFLTLTAALGIDALFPPLLRAMRQSPRLAEAICATLGLMAALLLSQANLVSMPDYFRRETSQYKELFDYLAWNKTNVAVLGFSTNRNQKLIARWYLPQVFTSLSRYDDRSYKRAFFLFATDYAPAQATFPLIHVKDIQDVAVYRTGLANRAPLPILPDASGRYLYTEDFSSLNMYNDCLWADNLAPDRQTKTLAHYDQDRPGEVVYRFAAPDGPRLDRASLSVRLGMALLAHVRPDSVVTFTAEAEGGPPVSLATVDYAAFLDQAGRLPPPNHEKKYFLEKILDLPPEILARGRFDIRVHYAPVRENGVIMLESLALDVQTSGPRPDAIRAAHLGYRALAANTPLATYVPGLSRVASNALYVFAATPDLDVQDAPWNASADLARFAAEHPGLPPVLTLPGPDGQPVLLAFDPALADPFLSLEPARPLELASGVPTPWPLGTLQVSGRLDRDRLVLGDRDIPVPVLAPTGSTVLLNPGAQGVLRIEPSFADTAFVDDPLLIKENLRKNPGEDCLSCPDAAPCALTIPISSDYPIKRLRIEFFPRVFADKEGKYAVRVLISPDGKRFSPLGGLTSNASGRWEGLMIRQVATKTFHKPWHNLFVRFELSGQGAQLWSRQATRMRVEALLDARAMPEARMDGPKAAMRLTSKAHGGLKAFVSPERNVVYQDLLDDY